MANPHPEPGEIIDVSPLLTLDRSRIAATKLVKPVLEVVRLVVPAGKDIAMHTAPGEVTVQCLEGAVDFIAAGRTHRLTPGRLAPWHPARTHGVEDASVLVTVVRCDAGGRDGHGVLRGPAPVHRVPRLRARLAECETHKGHSMIHIEYVERSTSRRPSRSCVCTATARRAPTSARPMPSAASADGQVMTARKPRCIACSNCVLACPFGVPKMMAEFDLMMKCDMCYDRTSTGRKPMCHRLPERGPDVCPTGGGRGDAHAPGRSTRSDSGSRRSRPRST